MNPISALVTKRAGIALTLLLSVLVVACGDAPKKADTSVRRTETVPGGKPKVAAPAPKRQAQVPATTPKPQAQAAAPRPPAQGITTTAPTGIYAIDQDSPFNVLDQAVFDPDTGQVTLIGHREAAYGRMVPYMQHLAALLDNPRPEFSLNWPLGTETKIDALFRRMDNPQEVRRMAQQWAQIVDANGRVTANGRYWLKVWGVSPPPGATGADPWSSATRYDVFVALLRAAGNEQAARLVQRFASVERHKNVRCESITPGPCRELWNAKLGIVRDSGQGALYDQLDAQVKSGRTTPVKAASEMNRAMCRGLDKAFGFTDQPCLSTYDRHSDPEVALPQAFAALDRKLLQVPETILGPIWARLDEVQIPPAMVEAAAGARFEVVPDFRGVDPGSQLARVMYEADYLGKELINMPELSGLIPAYKTEFAFERAHPEKATARRISTHHMWISVDEMSVAQSPEGRTLRLGNVAMRFNLREKGPNGRDLPAPPGGYEQLLTSMYGQLATHVPVFHELRECAKLAAVARWIQSKRPDFRLPREGRSRWSGPSSVPGMVYLTWTPRPRQGVVNASMLVMGGVSLVVNPFGLGGAAALRDSGSASVVDLSRSEVTVPRLGYDPAAPQNAALKKYLRPLADVPVPRPEGWVTPATRGARTGRQITAAMSVVPTGGDGTGILVHRQLEQCRVTATHLEEVERAINVINAENPDRQRAFLELGSGIQKANDALVETTIDTLTVGLLEAHGHLREMRLTGRFGILGGTAAQLADMQGALDEVNSQLGKLQQLHDDFRLAVGGDRVEQVRRLTAVAQDLLTKMESATGALGAVLRPLARTLNYAEKLRAAARVGGDLSTIYAAAQELSARTTRTDQQLAALRDRLLPRQRSLSIELGRCLSHPALRKVMAARY